LAGISDEGNGRETGRDVGGEDEITRREDRCQDIGDFRKKAEPGK
jgi:hypothetical protein